MPSHRRNTGRQTSQEAAKPKVRADLALQKKKSHTELLPITQAVQVFVRDRTHAPRLARLYIGATNSGKTYNGLLALFNDYEQSDGKKQFVYSSPLRLLAYEVYKKMVARYGEDKVGFITGEESTNPDAPLLATTVEMAPEEGESILIDEAHWLTDPDRGHVWTRLIIGARYNQLYIATAREAVPLIKELVTDAYVVEEQAFERKTPIVYAGQMHLRNVPPKTAVVCFARRSVYMIAQEVARGGLRVGVLYGALPLAARKQQLDAYERGELDVMVTTDVIGHGINLPIDNVVFAETSKFDGRERRSLHIWEAAQIAGRAGRFGLSEEGRVYVATGQKEQKETIDFGVVRKGVKAAAGKIDTDLNVTEASLFPRLGDLGIPHDEGTAGVVKLAYALEVWRRKAPRLLKDRKLVASEMNQQRTILRYILNEVGAPQKLWDDDYKLHTARKLKGRQNISVIDAWRLLTGAFDEKNGVLSAAIEWLGLSEDDRATSSILSVAFEDSVGTVIRNDDAAMFDLERAALQVGEYKMLAISFGHLGLLQQWTLENAEMLINSAISQRLVEGGDDGHPCTKCGKLAPYQFRLCHSCYRQHQVKKSVVGGARPGRPGRPSRSAQAYARSRSKSERRDKLSA